MTVSQIDREARPPDSDSGLDRRVLMVAFDFPPSAMAGVFRTARFTSYLRDFGWEPIVLTPEPAASRRPQDESLLDSIPEDLTVVRTPVPEPDETVKRFLCFGRSSKKRSAPSQQSSASETKTETNTASAAPHRPNLPKRIIRGAWNNFFHMPDEKIGWKHAAVRAGLETIREHQPSIVYSTGPPHSAHLIANQIAAKAGLPHVADFRDPWARAPWRSLEMGAFRSWLLSRCEKRVMRRATHVILNTDALRADFAKTYPGLSEKFSVITNGFDPRDLAKIEALPSKPAGDEFVICHPGSLYSRRDPRPLVAALERIQGERKVVFQQIGHHDAKFGLAGTADKADSLVRLIPPIPHHEVFEKVSGADCLLLLQPITTVQIPGKLFEMIMFRKPILALTEGGPAADVVRDYNIGVVAASNDVDQIEQAVRSIVQNQQQGRVDGRWSDALSAFDGRELTRQLADCLTHSCPAR